MTGGTSGLFGVGAGATHLLEARPEIVICLCVSAVLCAAITAAVAIVATVVGRPPEARRMATLDRLARKAETASERRAAMALLAKDTAVARDETGHCACADAPRRRARRRAGSSSAPLG